MEGSARRARGATDSTPANQTEIRVHRGVRASDGNAHSGWPVVAHRAGDRLAWLGKAVLACPVAAGNREEVVRLCGLEGDA
jgi:hypothetical protein